MCGTCGHSHRSDSDRPGKGGHTERFADVLQRESSRRARAKDAHANADGMPEYTGGEFGACHLGQARQWETFDVSPDDTSGCPTGISSRRRPTHTQVLEYVVICSGSGVELNVQKSRGEVTSMENVSLSDHRMITAGHSPRQRRSTRNSMAKPELQVETCLVRQITRFL